MSLFGTSGGGVLGASGGAHNPMKDFEVQQPPEDSISKIAFSSHAQTSNYLVASSWDNHVSNAQLTCDYKVLPSPLSRCIVTRLGITRLLEKHVPHIRHLSSTVAGTR